ncbi:MAG: hypothetical protein WC858_03895 [Parcubacteria group bacterium]
MNPPSNLNLDTVKVHFKGLHGLPECFSINAVDAISKRGWLDFHFNTQRECRRFWLKPENQEAWERKFKLGEGLKEPGNYTYRQNNIGMEEMYWNCGCHVEWPQGFSHRMTIYFCSHHWGQKKLPGVNYRQEGDKTPAIKGTSLNSKRVDVVWGWCFPGYFYSRIPIGVLTDKKFKPLEYDYFQDAQKAHPCSVPALEIMGWEERNFQGISSVS